MGEAYGLGALAVACAIAGWLVVMKFYPKGAPPANEGGTWRRAQETVATRSGSLIRVYLVREHEGRETGRVDIREIESGAANWDDLYNEAIVTADMRLAALESAERH